MIYNERQLKDKGFKQYKEGGVAYYSLSLDEDLALSSWITTNDVEEDEKEPSFVLQFCNGHKPIVDKYLSLDDVDLVLQAYSYAKSHTDESKKLFGEFSLLTTK